MIVAVVLGVDIKTEFWAWPKEVELLALTYHEYEVYLQPEQLPKSGIPYYEQHMLNIVAALSMGIKKEFWARPQDIQEPG
jgi:hypothetical protein